MGWEKRGNGLYYYRKKRMGQRVVSEYMGTGLFGSIVFQIWITVVRNVRCYSDRVG